MYQEYVPKQEGDFVVASEDGGTSVPVAITFLANDETDTIESVIEYWIPRDGGYYTKDIKNKFPEDAWDKLKDEDKFIKELRTMNLDKVNAAFKEFTYTQESFDALIDEICRSPQQSSTAYHLSNEKNDDVSNNYTFSPRAFAIRRCPWAYFICRKIFRHHNMLHGHEKYFPVFALLTGISCHWFMAKNVVFDYNDNRIFVRLEVIAGLRMIIIITT